MHLLCLNGELFKKRKDEEEPLCLSASILCVKDVILKISKTAKNVRVMAYGIEHSIVRIILKKFSSLILLFVSRGKKREMSLVFNKISIEFENELCYIQVFPHQDFMMNSTK